MLSDAESAERRAVMVAGPAGTVLLVEDDDSMREAIERLLRAGGFGCTAYAMADALLARGLDEGSVCVISDLRLPGMSGLDLLAELRGRDVVLPFILITGHDAPGLRQQALRCGAAAYLAKPFRGTTLLQTVRAAIERRPQA
jgi:FixJ family two-component response regulator